MRFYFVRHGIAEDLATSDFARELTKRGAPACRQIRRGDEATRYPSKPDLQQSTLASAPDGGDYRPRDGPGDDADGSGEFRLRPL